ncbi:MAG TPA: ParA family protein [Pirellulales bacterium]|jgi:chromosome partitioning protein
MKFIETQVIALANQKGGCGKTTTAISLAAAFAHEGYSVTLIDNDPQCNATDSFGIDRDQLIRDGRFSVADAYMTKRPARDIELDFGDRFNGLLKVIPGNRGINTIERRLESQMQTALANGEHSDLEGDDMKSEHRKRLALSIDSIRGARDIILIDTPPELGFLMTTALIAADWYIIPVFPSGFDLRGLEALLRNVQKVQERYNPELYLLGVLLGNSDARAKLDSDIRNLLIKDFGKGVFETPIARSVRHREATVNGLTIFEHADQQQAATQFLALAREVLRRLTAAENIRTNHAKLKEANRGQR